MQEPINWQKSSFCGGGDGAECIEVARVVESIQLRESDNPEAVITTAPTRLKAFIIGIKSGEFDRLVH
jgi:hypothetical protein